MMGDTFEPFDEQQIANKAWEFLRSNSTATLKFGEHMHEVSYVITHDGRLIIPAMVAMLQMCDTVMFVPQYQDDCMELQITLQEFKAVGTSGLFADKWQVYHGTPPDVQWATAEIDAARFHEMFIDGACLQQKNPLAHLEAAICTKLNNEYKSEVQRSCVRHANVDVIAPVIVGVDPLGIDVRATFGIVRLPSATSFTSLDDVVAFVAST